MTPTQAAAERLDIDELERVGDLARQRKAAAGLLLPGDKIMCRFEDEALANWPSIIAALREGERLRDEVARMSKLLNKPAREGDCRV